MDKKANLSVEKIIIWNLNESNGDPAPMLPEGIEPELREGDGPDDGYNLKDRRIADETYRSKSLQKGEGVLSIALAAGDSQIGDIFVNVQFERHSGESEACVAEHNALVLASSDWLSCIFGEIATEEAEFGVSIDVEPCPKQSFGINIREFVQKLTNQHKVTRVRKVKIQQEHRQEDSS